VRTEGKRGPRCGGVVQLLFERGRVRQGAVGVGRRGRRVEEAGHEQEGGSLPTGERRSTGNGPKSAGARAVRTLPTEQRGKGETDGWAAATVPGGGDADEQGPSGSGRGREGREWRAGTRGPAREEKGVVEPRCTVTFSIYSN
jgi:hypothetical protein